MNRYLSAFLATCITFGFSTAQAQVPASASTVASMPQPTPSSKPSAKKVTKKKVVKRIAIPARVEDDEEEPDVAGTTAMEYQCELGSKLTVFKNNNDNKHIALKWGKRLHRMERIDTTTGANRFENRHYGLVWIDIPAKGILLNAKTGHQLANECKTVEQLAHGAIEMPTATTASKG